MARLDRLPSIREVAQLGAVLGREFAYEMVQAIVSIEETNPARGTSSAGRSRAALSARPATTRQVHLQARPCPGRRIPIIAQAHAAVLSPAGGRTVGKPVLGDCPNPAGAVGPPLHRSFAYRAGRCVLDVSWGAGDSAVGQCGSGRAPDKRSGSARDPSRSLDRAKQELAFRLSLGPAMMSSKGASVPEVERTYLRARELGGQVGDDSQRFAALWGLWMFNITRARFQTAQGLVDELLAIAQRQSDPALLLEAHHAAWNTNFNLAELVSSRDHTEQGRRLYDPHEHRTHKFLYGGHDPGVCSRSYGGMALCLLGYPDQAWESAKDAVALAEELAHRGSLANALCLGAFIHQFRRDLSRCGECADAAVTLCREPEMPSWLAMATLLRGYSLAARGQAREGIGQMRQALAAMQAPWGGR